MLVFRTLKNWSKVNHFDQFSSAKTQCGNQSAEMYTFNEFSDNDPPIFH